MLQKTVFSLELMNLTFWHPTGGGTNEWIPNASTIGLSHLRCHLYNLELVNCKVFCEILKDSFIRSTHLGKMEAPANSTPWILNLANFKVPICNQNSTPVFWLHTPHSLRRITVLQNIPKINSTKVELSRCHPFISTYLTHVSIWWCGCTFIWGVSCTLNSVKSLVSDSYSRIRR